MKNLVFVYIAISAAYVFVELGGLLALISGW